MPNVPFIPEEFANVTHHFTCTGVAHSISTSYGVFVGEQALGLVASFLNSLFKASLMQDGARLSTVYTYTGLTMISGNVTGPHTITEQPDSLAGTMIAQVLPPNCALLVTKRTALLGRRYRGRMFFPGGYLPESEVSSAGIIDPAVLSGHAVTLDEWLQDLEDSLNPMYLLHQFDPDDPESTPVLPTKVTQLQAAPLIATQRNRMR